MLFQERTKRKSGRTAARRAQSENRAGAGIVVRADREHRRQADRARGGRRHAGHSRVHGPACAGDQDLPIAVELPPIEKPADCVEAAASIVAAVAAGELTANEAAQLAKVVDVYVRAVDSKGFDERLSSLEKEIRGAPAAPAHAAAGNGGMKPDAATP